MPLDTHASLANLDLHEAKRIKIPVRAASTANVSLTAPGATIDGVTLVANDRILLKNQATASQNGLYVWTGAAATLTRATDASSAALLFFGFLVYVREGTANGGTLWMFTQSAAVTLETTALTFSAVGATNLAGEMTAADFNVTGLTGATAGMRMVGATTTGAPTTGTFAVGDVVDDRAAGGLWACTVAGTPGTWVRTGFANPMTTVGDLIVGGTAGAATRLAAGTATNVLTSNGPGVSPTWQPAPAGGGGGTGGGSGNPVSNSLAADVSVPTANVFVDGPTLTLTPGTWNLTGQVTCVNAVATDFTAKLWDGTTVLDSAQDSSRVGTVGISIQVSGAVVVTATTTFKISVAGNNATSTIKAATTVNASGNTASTLTATPAGSPAPGNTSNALYQQTKIRNTGNKTTTSTSFVAIDATNLPPLTLVLTAGDVVRCVLEGSSQVASGTGAQYDFQVVQPTLGTTRTNPTAVGGATIVGTTNQIPVTAVATFTAAETGSHTFQPVWSTVTSALSITLFNSSAVGQDTEILFSAEKMGPAPVSAGSGTGLSSSGVVPIQIVGPLTATQASVTFAVPATYRSLRLSFTARASAASGNEQLLLRMNGDSGATNYDSIISDQGGVADVSKANLSAIYCGYIANASNSAGIASSGEIWIQGYQGTTYFKNVETAVREHALNRASKNTGTWKNTAAVTSLTLSPEVSAAFDVGTYFVLWGELDTAPTLPASQASLIQEVVLGTAAASIALSNIPQTYRDLRLVIESRSAAATGPRGLIQFNGDATAADYSSNYAWTANSTGGAGTNYGQQASTTDTGIVGFAPPGTGATAGRPGVATVIIPDYAGSTWQKHVQFQWYAPGTAFIATANILSSGAGGGAWFNTAPITSITLVNSDASNFVAGTVVRLYGEPATALPKIGEVVLAANQATVVFSGIPQTYRSLRLVGQCRGSGTTANTRLILQLNGDATAADYETEHFFSIGVTTGGETFTTLAGVQITNVMLSTGAAGRSSSFEALLPNYNQTTFHKSVISRGGFVDATVGRSVDATMGNWANTSAVTSLTVAMSTADSFIAGSTFTLYGEP